MDALAAIEKRVSVRKFTPQPVSEEDLRKILRAASLAPSARNVQPWEFVVVREARRRAELAKIVSPNGDFIADAPACVVVFCRDTKYYLEDGCAAATQFLLAATSLGLAACWVAGDKKNYCSAVKKFLLAPEDCKLICLLPVGYAAEAPHQEKLPLDPMVHQECFHA